MPDLLDSLFGDDAVAVLVSDRARIQRMLDVEIALAEAEAALGIIPLAAAATIRAAADAATFDLDAIGREAANAGNLAIPLVAHLTRHVAERDADAARYVHWGATSQDVIDTGLVLQLRDAAAVLGRCLARAAQAAAALAERHVDTPMAGRTWLQHATPITFGLKSAGWLDALDRQRDALETAQREVSVLQFGGASGTLASLGARGLEVMTALAARLDLRVPDLPWHAHRGRLVSFGCALGVTTGALGKIARDLSLLSQTEIAEAMEAPAEGRGGSSTMPHKRNPIGAAIALTASVRAPGLVATLLSAMPHEHERALGGWQAEWSVFPELVTLTGGAARAIADALEHLVVDAPRMRANLDITHGLVLAEAIAMALGEHVGKRDAHALVEAASRRAIADDRPLADTLADDPAVTRWLSPEQIRARLTPESYLGSSRAFVARVLASHQKRDASDACHAE